MNRVRLLSSAGAAALVLGIGACGASGSAPPSGVTTSGTTAVENCGRSVQYGLPKRRIVVNDSGMIAMLAAIDADPAMAAFSSLNRDRGVIERHYGPLPAGREQLDSRMPSLETVLAQRPDLVFAGWGYGFAEGEVTPEALTSKGIDVYELSEACRRAGQKARGTMDPWRALKADLTNLGTLTGHTSQAATVTTDIDRRRSALEAAPTPARRPQVLVFDSGEKDVFTSGRFGGPQAVIDTAGGRNVMDDVADTWTSVSWERLAATRPDVIVFVDYGEQSFAQKVAVLEANPATRDLPAVTQKRYLNLPYAMWVSSPLNIDAAEQLRARMEGWGLLPASGLAAPRYDDHVAVSAS